MKEGETVTYIRTVPLVLMAALFFVPASASWGHGPPVRVCDFPKGLEAAACDSLVLTDGVTPQATQSPTGYGPSVFHVAYSLPTAANGAQTVAIVDAYDDPNAKADLDTYDAYYGLPFFPSCSATLTTACFSKVDQSGGSSYPSPNSGWALEISLDVQIAHAVCQDCKILLVEANSNLVSALARAENTAAKLGGQAISNSYGTYSEFSRESHYAGSYDHTGVAITVSSGDSGFGTNFPSSLNTVIAVGGTSLRTVIMKHGKTKTTSYAETAWPGSGSGCSVFNTAQSWQLALPNWSATQCGSARAVADVAADADPATGAAVYDSYPYSGQTGWWQVGGTSLSSPLIAAVYALAGNTAGFAYPALLSYANAGSLHDVTSGSNGSCGTIMCQAGSGYDGPTGLGTPNGLAGF